MHKPVTCTDTHGNTCTSPHTHAPTHIHNPQLQEHVWEQARTDTREATGWTGTQAPRRTQNDTRVCKHA